MASPLVEVHWSSDQDFFWQKAQSLVDNLVHALVEERDPNKSRQLQIRFEALIEFLDDFYPQRGSQVPVSCFRALANPPVEVGELPENSEIMVYTKAGMTALVLIDWNALKLHGLIIYLDKPTEDDLEVIGQRISAFTDNSDQDDET